MSDLAVAIFTTAGGDCAPTLESVRASAEQNDAGVEVLLVSTSGHEPPARASTADILELFPLGLGYAKTRVLEATKAPAVAFVDDTVCVGRRWVGAILEAMARSTAAAVLGPVRPYESDAWRSGESVLAARALRGTAQTSNLTVARDRALAIGGFPIRLEPAAAPYEDLALIASFRRRRWDAEWLPAAAVECVNEGRRRVDSAAVRGFEAGRAIRQSHGRLAGACARAVLHHPRVASPAVVPALVRGMRRPRPRTSPVSFLDRLPASVSRRIDAEIKPLPASSPPKTHLMYDVGGRLLLHLHVAPSPRLRRSLAEREQIRARTGALEGIPRLHATHFEADAVWILEDRLPGEHPAPADVDRWFAPVAQWAVRLAGPPGPPLGEVPEWSQHCADLVEAFPVHEEPLLRSLGLVGEVASRHMHGDFQRRNVVFSGSSVGLVDWDGAWLHGIPGLDLVFLSLLARSDRPEAAVLADLLAGRDPEFGPLLSQLDRAGAPRPVLRPLLVAMLATWALGEKRRIRRSRLSPHPRPFGELLDEFLPWAQSDASC